MDPNLRLFFFKSQNVLASQAKIDMYGIKYLLKYSVTVCCSVTREFVMFTKGIPR